VSDWAVGARQVIIWYRFADLIVVSQFPNSAKKQFIHIKNEKWISMMVLKPKPLLMARHLVLGV
jgi:hypothetical protein